jgi:hypothetical protein
VALFVAAAGLAGLFVVASTAGQWLEEAPWADKVVLRSKPQEGADAVSFTLRRLGPHALAEGALSGFEQGLIVAARQSFGGAGAGAGGLWIAGEQGTDPEFLAPLLESGRLPEPGQPEALAGDMAPGDSFSAEDVTFTVVGRLDRRAALFSRSFVIPYHADFDALVPEDEPTRVWVAPESQAPGGEGEQGVRTFTKAGMVRMPGGWHGGAIAALAAVLLGGAGLQALALMRLARLRIPVLGPSLEALTAHPVLLWGGHIGLYGAWMLFMCLAPAAPRSQATFLALISGVFTEGHLAYIGEAYTSKNVLLAAAATWVNNYLLQTLGLTFIFSLLLAPWGLLKTLLSFTVLGFAMSPGGANLVQGFTYHSVTMALELEAYVLACFFVGVFWLNLARLLAAERPGRFLARSCVMYASGAALTGVLLAVAAAYEAVTLIAAM